MSKAIRNIIYELTYNPILEYWELIKYKPIFQKVEGLKKELNSIKKDKNNDEISIKIKEKELENANKELNKVKLKGAINSSYKVYRVYKEIVK